LAVSDPVALDVPALGDLAVSLYLPENVAATTQHSGGLQTNHISAAGDFTGAITVAGTTTQSFYFLTGVEVRASERARAIVTLGDSHTDGFGSTPGGRLSAIALLVFELTRCRSLPRSTPDVDDPDDVGAFIDGEEHAIRMRTATVVENTNRLIGIEALRRPLASFWVLIERKNRLFETVEPRRALAWRSLDDPEIQLFELSFGVLGELNAVCHACVEAG
jgi:hypothetical protein